MNKRQIETEKAKLAAEARELKELKAIYSKAADDIAKKIRLSDGKINVLLKDFDNLDDTQKSILQSQIYQRKFQQQLKTQIDGYMSALLAGQYKSIDDYMRNCYTMGFVGAMYDISGQGIPLVIPIDEKQVVKALYTNSKISKKLYTKLGEDVAFLKKRIASTLSRGIATADSYANIARNLASDSNVGFNRAMRIARTEGHRIQANSAFDAQMAAKEAGADIVKQWDATLDGRTRPNHRKLDGQIRELEEPFEVGGMKAMYPSGFGRPEEDINCRCALMQRARWALDEDELKTLKERAAFFGLDKTKDFNDFKKKYLKAGVPQQIFTNNIKNVNTISELETEMAKITGKSIDLAGTDLDLMKKNMEQLIKLGEEYGYKFTRIEASKGKAYLGNVIRKGRYGEDITLLYPKKYYKSRTALLDELKKSIESGNMPKMGGRNADIYTTTHEFAHTLSEELTSRLYGGDDDFWDEIDAIFMEYKKHGNGVLGKYAASNQNEFLAEAFAQAKLSANPSPYAIKVLETVDKYFKKSTKSGNGLGAKIGGEGLIALHEEPALLKTIDYSKKKDVRNELKDFEKNAITESGETACVVTAEGEVYKCFGVEDRVFPDYDLSDKLKGASVSHNHPIDETIFSFSRDDLKLFMDYDLDILRGCDEKYTYEFNRNPTDIDDMPEDWMTFENFNHADIIRLAKEYGIGYRRWENE